VDGKQFDELSRRFATRQTRRSMLGLIGAAAAGVLMKGTAGAAPKKEQPSKEQSRKCYGEGSSCTNGKQCCSNVCTNRQCAAELGTECVTAADCAGTNDECQTRTCIDGICGAAHTSYGVLVSGQILGNCQSNVCNGSGGVITIADDSDAPANSNDCMSVSCSGGTASTAYLPANTLCGTNGGAICNGAGQCVVCIPGETQPCYSGPEGTDGVGVCQAGTKTCQEDGSGFDECTGEILPSPEMCNGLDDDCDGMVDEGVLEEGISCHINVPEWWPGNCDQGKVQCLNGELRCCSTTCSDIGGPLCV
jgi:hypothetical protein